MNTDSLPARFGDYTLLKKIASGGMAEIFLAEAHSATGGEKLVALKMIHPRYAEERHFHRMMVEEARIAVQLGHPNIGQVFDLGQYGGRYFLVMEFIDGLDLSRTHERCRDRRVPFPIEVAAFVGHEVAAALAYAHQLKDRKGRALGLIHRDISPQNVLLAFNGEVKIIDFGIAKVATQMQQTQVGVIKGKFYYMSPEQAGAQDVDQRSDLFSLGICLWETLVGRSLFRRDDGPTNPLAILHEVRSMPIPRVRDVRPDCPQELDNIIARALSRDLSVRYANAEALREVLARFLAPLASRGQPAALLEGFMAQLFGRSDAAEAPEPPREAPGRRVHVPTGPIDRMQRDEFAPSDASVIFSLGRPSGGQGIDLDWMDPATATRVFEGEGRIPRSPAIARARTASSTAIPVLANPASPFVPVADPEPTSRMTPVSVPARTPSKPARPEPVRAEPVRAEPVRAEPVRSEPAKQSPLTRPSPPARPPPPPEPAEDIDDLAFGDTVYVRRDAIEEMRQRGSEPEVVGRTQQHHQDDDEEDPNVRTMHVDAKAIRAAHEAFAEKMAQKPSASVIRVPEARAEPAIEPPVADEAPLSTHPLFRWLVILILVLCVLSATLALLLLRRRAAASQAGGSVPTSRIDSPDLGPGRNRS